MSKLMSDFNIARVHCCNWRVYDFGPLKGKPGCLWDKPCEPDKCKRWPIVEACAARAASMKKKGA